MYVYIRNIQIYYVCRCERCRIGSKQQSVVVDLGESWVSDSSAGPSKRLSAG